MASPSITVECRAGTIELREFTPSDVTMEYVDWMNDPEVVQYTRQSDRLHSAESVTRYAEQQLASKAAHLFGIFHEGLHIGNIKLGPVEGRKGCAEVGYIIGRKDYWNKGVASAVVRAVADFGLKELGLGSIEADCHEENVASVKALRNAGFEIEGHFTGECAPNGESVDQVKLSRKAV